MIILDAPYAQVTFKKDKELGMITWQGKSTSEEYRNTFLTLLDQQEKEHISKYISDIRNQAIVSPDDRKWFETVAMPRAIKQGLQKAAVVFDGNAFKKYYLNVILSATNKFGLPMKVFTNLEDAEAWLEVK